MRTQDLVRRAKVRRTFAPLLRPKLSQSHARLVREVLIADPIEAVERLSLWPFPRRAGVVSWHGER